jgi:hypothetical protein
MKKVSLVICFLLIAVGAMASTIQIKVTNKSLFDSVAVSNPLLDSGINVKIAHSVIKAGESDIITVTYDNSVVNKKFNLEFKKPGYDATVKCQIKKDYFGKVGITYLDNGGLAGDNDTHAVYDKDINISLK